MSDIRTQYYRPVEKQSATLMILDNKRKPRTINLSGSMSLGREYPDSNCDIKLSSDITSRRHGEFIYDDSDGTYYYIDNNSSNGTYINGNKLQSFNQRGSRAYKLSDGDILRIDRKQLNLPHPQAVLMIFSKRFEVGEKWNHIDISGIREVTIGRDNGNVIQLDDMMASRQHAVISCSYNGVVLQDLNSQNGVAVNRVLVRNSTRIYNYDVIRIANTTLIFMNNIILYNNAHECSGSLSVSIEKKVVGIKKKVLIRDIRFEAEQKDFILILGGSGSGKTTLVKAILGDGKADGTVIIDGQNLYENFKTLKSKIGLVPQFLNLRENDKVQSTLMDMADVKLDSKDYSKSDKLKRVNEIMERLGITNLQNHLLRQLSGGQKKKVSVAAQLVGFQSVFICDEPDSGLDAASRTQQMEILKEISENNKIVMVISHEPDDAVNRETGECLFTKVLVLAKSSKDNCGTLAFFGSPQMALDHFEVDKLQDIMIKINPPYEGGKGMADYYIDKYNSSLRGGF